MYNRMPDIIVKPYGYVLCRAQGLPYRLHYSIPPLNTYDHTLYGTFIAFGADLKRGIKLSGISIVDIAPTILHLFNLHAPNYMDGRIIFEIFKERTKV